VEDLPLRPNCAHQLHPHTHCYSIRDPAPLSAHSPDFPPITCQRLLWRMVRVRVLTRQPQPGPHVGNVQGSTDAIESRPAWPFVALHVKSLPHAGTIERLLAHSPRIFPGLEDTNRSFILQPVLQVTRSSPSFVTPVSSHDVCASYQVGRSGCVLDPLLYRHWHFTSYFVDSAGRAKCGAVLRVEEGDEVGDVAELIEMRGVIRYRFKAV
jgi:hypothetical protein